MSVTLHALFHAEVLRNPTAVAVDAAGTALTYHELDTASNRLAHRLRDAGVPLDGIVGLLLPRGAALATAALAAVKAGAAFLPIDPAYPDERVTAMLSGVAVAAVVAQEAVADRLAVAGRIVVAPDAGPGCDAPPSVSVHPDQLAYVCYTSGSTGRPKAVGVTHAGIAGFTSALRALGAGPGARVLQVSSPAFDASVWEMCMALLTGATLVPVADDERYGAGLGRVLAARGITHALLIPSVLATVDLDPITVPGLTLAVGGEACPQTLVDRWAPGRLMVNAYGPTEATVCATMSGALRPGTTPPLGAPVPGTEVRLLDAGGREAMAGEIYLAGPGLARGYLGDPATTADRFVPDPYGPPGARLYRTGDMGIRTADGDLRYAGRTDRQVKVRGFRIEPGEVEDALQRCAGVRQAAVVVRGDALAAFVTGARDGEALRAELTRILPAHLVPATVTVLDALPLTATGKLDHAALPREPDALTTRPTTDPAEVLRAEVAIAVGRSEVTLADSFTSLGGHSLAAVRVASAFLARTGRHVDPTHIMRAAALGELLTGPATAPRVPPPLAGMSRGRWPLTAGQLGMWLLDQLDPTGLRYVVARAYHLERAPDASALRQALADLADRHDMLGAAIVGIDGEPQARPAVGPPPLEVLTSVGPDWMSDALAPFDLSAGPLLRATLAPAANGATLLVQIHHLACDGWSMDVFERELDAAYQARRAGHPYDRPAALRFADFATWREAGAGQPDAVGGVVAADLAFWRTRLAGLTGEHPLPAGQHRSAAPTGRGGVVPIEIGSAVHRRLASWARGRAASVSAAVYACLALTLRRLGAGPDFALGASVAGRDEPATHDLIGFVANTVVLRLDMSGRPAFDDVLDQVRCVLLDALDHQWLPFPTLVASLRPPQADGHPYFRVMVSLDGRDRIRGELCGSPVRIEDVHTGTAKFDLTLYLREHIGPTGEHAGLRGYLEYDEETLGGPTAMAVATAFIQTVTSAT